MEDVAAGIREIAAIPCDDEILFDPSSVETEGIEENAEYEGVRAKFTARLEQALSRTQVDVGFGDAVDPPLTTDRFPAVLNGISTTATANVSGGMGHCRESPRHGFA